MMKLKLNVYIIMISMGKLLLIMSDMYIKIYLICLLRIRGFLIVLLVKIDQREK